MHNSGSTLRILINSVIQSSQNLTPSGTLLVILYHAENALSISIMCPVSTTCSEIWLQIPLTAPLLNHAEKCSLICVGDRLFVGPT